jgi:hypothetical protein
METILSCFLVERNSLYEHHVTKKIGIDFAFKIAYQPFQGETSC